MSNNSHSTHPARMLILLLLAISTLLTACSAAASTGATPTVASATRTPQPTFTVPANTPTATLSPTPAPSPTPLQSPTPTPLPTPTINPYLNPLTGETVADPAVLQRRPLLVRIGNDAEVRPQSGLSQADMVIEEAMDGFTITRLTAVIWSRDPEVLKPIRSARLFTIELGYMFDGALVHSGANDTVRWLISQSGLTDLDEYFHPKPYYWLKPEGAWTCCPWMGRVATGAKRLRDYMSQKGKEKAVHLPGFIFSQPGDATPAGQSAAYVKIPYPKRALVEYRYDAANGAYKRFVQGVAHNDATNGKQLAPANVIVLYTKYVETAVKDVRGAATLDIELVGEGRVQVIRDGVVIEGTWKKPASKDWIQFLDAAGRPIPLHVGQTWLEVVPKDYQVVCSAS